MDDYITRTINMTSYLIACKEEFKVSYTPDSIIVETAWLVTEYKKNGKIIEKKA